MIYYAYIPVQFSTFYNSEELMLVRVCSELYTWGIFSLLLYHWESCSFIIYAYCHDFMLHFFSLYVSFFCGLFHVLHIFFLGHICS